MTIYKYWAFIFVGMTPTSLIKGKDPSRWNIPLMKEYFNVSRVTRQDVVNNNCMQAMTASKSNNKIETKKKWKPTWSG